MKTGGGKSLCYQLPALAVSSGFYLVISPLLALIRDQVAAINKIRPGSAASLASALNRSDQTTIYKTIEDCGSSGLRLLYVTPEKIIKSKMLMTSLQRCYERGTLRCLVLDEAHCASQWCFGVALL